MGHWYKSAVSHEVGRDLVTMAWKNCNAGPYKATALGSRQTKIHILSTGDAEPAALNPIAPPACFPSAPARPSSRGMGPCSPWWSTHLGQQTRVEDVLGLKHSAVDGAPLPAAKVFPAVPTHDVTNPRKWRRTI